MSVPFQAARDSILHVKSSHLTTDKCILLQTWPWILTFGKLLYWGASFDLLDQTDLTGDSNVT